MRTEFEVDEWDEGLWISSGNYGSPFVATADRPAAALAVLGGITPELVERVTAELLTWGCCFDVDEGYQTPDEVRADACAAARQLLAVVFGVEG